MKNNLTILVISLLSVFTQLEAQPGSPVYEKPIAAFFMDEAFAGGEFIGPDLSRYTKKQAELYKSEEFIFSGILALATTQSGYYGFIDENKKWIIPPIYKEIRSPYVSDESFENKFIVQDKNSKWGLINYQGRKIIEIKYDTLFSYTAKGLMIAKQNNKYGAISLLGDVEIPFLYDSIQNPYVSPYEEGMFAHGNVAAMQHKKWGFINPQGKKVIDFIYDDVTGNFSMGLVGVKQKGKWGFIDTKGNTRIPFIYLRAQGFDLTLEEAWVSLSDKEDDDGFSIDKDGKKKE
jgi:hypothetical protein